MITKKDRLTGIRAILDFNCDRKWHVERGLPLFNQFTQVEKFVKENALFYRCETTDPGTIWLVFPGSNDLQDWVGNFCFFPSAVGKSGPYTKGASNGMEIHSGFMDYYLLIREAVIAACVRVPGVNEIKVCGHSLGAAVATYAAVDIKRTLPSKTVDCLAYSSPKPGNKHFCTYVETMLRGGFEMIYAGADVVCRQPPAAFFWMGYTHPAPVIHVDAKRSWWTNLWGCAADHYPDVVAKGIEAMP